MNPHQILGVPSSASRDEIKRAFHTLAHKHHPDKGGNAEMFKKISAAYTMLKDKQPAPQVVYSTSTTTIVYTTTSIYELMVKLREQMMKQKIKYDH